MMSNEYCDPTWYEKTFGELYPLLYPHRSETAAAAEIAGLTTFLHVPPLARILDIGCGAGRHLLALVRAGFNAWGIDLATPLLTKAAERTELAGRLIRADMRYLPFESHFDLALNLFSSFGYFIEDDDNCLALRAFSRVLAAGGILIIDHINRTLLETNLVKESITKCGNLTFVQERQINGNRVVKRITVKTPNEPSRCFFENVRLYYPEELEAMLQQCGFSLIGIYSSAAGQPFNDQAERMIIAARRT